MDATHPIMKRSRLNPFALFATVIACGAISSAQAGTTYYWNTLTTSTWATGANWSTTATGGTTGVAPIAYDAGVFSQTAKYGTLAVQLAADASIGTITINNTGTTGLISTTTAHTLNLGGGGITTTTATGAVTLGNGTAIGNVLINLVGSQTWTHNHATNAFTLNDTAAAFSRTTGSTISFNQAGAGVFTIPAIALPNDATGIIGRWAFFGTGVNTKYATNPAGTIAGLTGTAAADGSGLIDTLGVANYDLATFGGTVPATVSANTIRYTGAAGTTTLGATGFTVNGLLNAGTNLWTLGTAPLTIGANKELLVNTANNSITVSSVIADSLAGTSVLTKLGGQTLTLSAANTYSGDTIVKAGTLILGATGSIDNSKIVLGDSGGATNATFQFTSPTAATFSRNITVGTSTGYQTLNLANTSGTGVLSGTVLLNGDLILNQPNGGTQTISNPITGTGGLRVNNSNTTGVVNLQGGTFGPIAAYFSACSGTLNVNAPVTASVSFALNVGWNTTTGGILNINNTSLTLTAGTTVAMGGGYNGNSSGTGTLNINGTVTNPGLFDLGTTGGNIFVGVASGQSGSGTLNINSYGTLATSRSITLRSYTALSTGTVNFDGGTLKLTASQANMITAPGTSPTAVNINAGGATIDTQSYGGGIAVPLLGSGILTKNGGGALTLSGANLYTGGTVVNAGALVFANTTARPATGTITVAAGASAGLGVNAATNPYTTADVDTLFAGTFTGVTSDPASLVGIDTSVASLTYTSTFLSSTLGLNKLGANTLTLSGTNNYSGRTLVSAGTLSINSIQDAGSATANALGNPAVGANSTIGILSGATLQYTGASAGSSNRVINLASLTGGSSTLDASGSIPFALSGGVTSSGTSGTSTLVLTGGLGGLGSQSAAIANGTSPNLTAVSKTGAGTWTLSGANTYTGGTTVSAGTMVFAGTGVLPTTGTFSLGAATASILNDGAGNNGTISMTSNNVLLSAIGGTLNVGNNGGSNTGNTLSLGALSTPAAIATTNTFTGSNGYLIRFASLALPGTTGNTTTLSPTTTSLTIAGNVTNPMAGFATNNYDTLTLDGTSTGNSISGVISNATGGSNAAGGYTRVTKSNTSTWTLAGASTYTSQTLVNGGTLKAGVASVANVSGAFGLNSAVTLANTIGVTMDITGYNTQIGSLTGGGVNGGNVTLGAATLTVGGDGTSPAEYVGSISGTGGLTKIGGGTQILSGTNPYTGLTLISAGNIAFNNSNALGGGTAAAIKMATTTILRPYATASVARGIQLTGKDAQINPTLAGSIATFTGGFTLSGYTPVTNDALKFESVGTTLISTTPLNLPGMQLNKGQGGTLELNVAGNTYNRIWNYAGTIKTGIAGALSASAQIDNRTTGSILDLNGFDQGVASLVGYTSNGLGSSITSASPATLTVAPPSGTPFAYDGTISGAVAITINGVGTQTLGGPNTYSGDTTVTAGTLSVTANTALPSGTTVRITSSGTPLSLTYASGTDTVNKLYIDGVQQAAGTWGSTTSTATNKRSYITGSGVLTVTSGPGYDGWASANGVTGGPNGDSNSNGISNLVEYALLDGTSGTLVGNTLTFYKRPLAVANGDVSYAIETSTDLGVTVPWTVVIPTVDNSTEISYDLTPPTPSKNFSRLKTTLTTP